MIQRVDTVLIGNKVNLKAGALNAVDDLAEGDVVLFDENRKLITSAANASTIYVGVIGKKIMIDDTKYTYEVAYSAPIKKDSKPRMFASKYSAPVQQSIDIDLTNATLVAGHRYVLRIVYKDIEGAPGQFTHTYEHVATNDDAATLLEVFKKKINKHANRRVNATVAGEKMTLVAMPKTDNEGVNSINEYSVVNMAVTMYETIPGQLLSNNPEDFGAVIETTSGVKATAGVGYWKQVRDQEVRNMGYKGMVYNGTFPAMAQELKTVAGAEYDAITIQNDNLYLSNDNQYVKTTPIVTEIYCPNANSLRTALKTFTAIVEVEGEELNTGSATGGNPL